MAEPARRLQARHMPLYRQLLLVLRDQIHRGALVAGAALPTEHVRCEQYGVSRITVRRALQDLSSGGLVERALFELNQDSGVTLGRVVQEITAEIADPVRARLLQAHI